MACRSFLLSDDSLIAPDYRVERVGWQGKKQQAANNNRRAKAEASNENEDETVDAVAGEEDTPSDDEQPKRRKRGRRGGRRRRRRGGEAENNQNGAEAAENGTATDATAEDQNDGTHARLIRPVRARLTPNRPKPPAVAVAVAAR